MRHKTLTAILAKTYACARQPLPTVEVVDFQARCFDEALADVPTEDLDTVYRRAIQAHTSTFPLTTGDLIIAWQGVQKDRLTAQRQAEQDAWQAEMRRQEAAQQAHMQRLETDPAYRAEHEARMARIHAQQRALRARLGGTAHVPAQ